MPQRITLRPGLRAAATVFIPSSEEDAYSTAFRREIRRPSSSKPRLP